MKYVLTSLLLLVTFFSFAQTKYAGGYRFDEEQFEQVPLKAALTRGDYEQLPAKYSLKNYCPKPGNQLQLETSSNWATTYGALTILDARVNNWQDADHITRNAYSPVFDYAIGTHLDNRNCQIASTLADVMDALKNYGTPRYVEFLEFCPDQISRPIYDVANDHRITDFFRLFKTEDPPEVRINAIKKSLSEDNPVIIGMICPPSFYIARDFWQPREKVDDSYGGQALCIIGYDDEKYGGSFEIMNSWGRQWGNDGYMWIRYGDLVEFTLSAYELFKVDEGNQDKIDFSGEIKLVLDNGNFIETELTGDPGYYKTKKSFKSGTNFRIYISNNETAYVYVFGTDLSNEYFKLFPYNDNISAVLNYKQNNIALPDENHHIQIVGDPGKDFLIILYSKQEIPIDSLIRKLKEMEGRIDVRVRNIMEDDLVKKDNIEWDQGKIRFSAKGKGKTLVPVFLEIDHE